MDRGWMIDGWMEEKGWGGDGWMVRLMDESSSSSSFARLMDE
jgi:hypothetical protein